MNLVYALLWLAAALVCALLGFTRLNVWLIEWRNPPAGAFMEIAGGRLHYVHVPAGPGADLPPVVFIHGASANLNDQMVPLRPLLEGRAELLFFDRPGHGWSERGGNDGSQTDQAERLALLMDRLGVRKAIVVAHSFGGSVAAALALSHPEKVAGLVFLSAATHPWPGGKTAWYYGLTARPLAGRFFAQTLALPAGLGRIGGAIACVFSPNPVPPDYARRAQIPLVLRPSAFRANAVDVNGMYDFALRNQPRYREIAAPTVVISGDEDTVVYEELHSLGLKRDIPGAELVWVRNLGHKPDWIAPDLVVASIEKLAGKPRDLQEAGRAVEARIAGDRATVPGCVNEKMPL